MEENKGHWVVLFGYYNIQAKNFTFQSTFSRNTKIRLKELSAFSRASTHSVRTKYLCARTEYAAHTAQRMKQQKEKMRLTRFCALQLSHRSVSLSLIHSTSESDTVNIFSFLPLSLKNFKAGKTID